MNNVKLPMFVFTTLDEIGEARELYNLKHAEFFGVGGILQGMTGGETPEFVRATWKSTMSPPSTVLNNWSLLLLWALWSLFSKNPMPMIIAGGFLMFYLAAACYFVLLAPSLHYIFT